MRGTSGAAVHPLIARQRSIDSRTGRQSPARRVSEIRATWPGVCTICTRLVSMAEICGGALPFENRHRSESDRSSGLSSRSGWPKPRRVRAAWV